MAIDPRVAFYFGVWTSVLLLVASGTINFTGALPDLWVPIVTKWCAILGAVNSTILTAASGYSSNKSGPMVNVPVNPAMTVVKILIAAFVLSMFLAVPSAQAQARKPADQRTSTTGLICDPANLLPGCQQAAPKLITGNAEKDAHAIWDKLVAASQADLKYASALAAAANTPASAVRKQCYDAIITLNTQVNGMNVKDANGVALPQPDPKLFTGVEQAAETIDNLSPSGPLFTNCAGMAQLTKTNVLTLINAIVTGAAAFAVMPVIPGL